MHPLTKINKDVINVKIFFPKFFHSNINNETLFARDNDNNENQHNNI